MAQRVSPRARQHHAGRRGGRAVLSFQHEGIMCMPSDPIAQAFDVIPRHIRLHTSTPDIQEPTLASVWRAPTGSGQRCKNGVGTRGHGRVNKVRWNHRYKFIQEVPRSCFKTLSYAGGCWQTAARSKPGLHCTDNSICTVLISRCKAKHKPQSARGRLVVECVLVLVYLYSDKGLK